LIITFVFEKNANFITQNWQKSQKLWSYHRSRIIYFCFINSCHFE
jgi:hypothetical protein